MLLCLTPSAPVQLRDNNDGVFTMAEIATEDYWPSPLLGYSVYRVIPSEPLGFLAWRMVIQPNGEFLSETEAENLFLP